MLTKSIIILFLANIYAASPPGTVYFAGGMPDGATFPFLSISIDLKDGSTMKIDGKLLETALQYQSSAGYFLLIIFLFFTIFKI
jgi:hypothetical protein